MRLIAVRRSVTARPLRLSEAELAIRSRRAANAGSEPTTRTTWSTDDLGSESTRLTRTAISGNEGRSTLPLDSSAASLRTKSKATLGSACNDVFVKFALTCLGAAFAPKRWPDSWGNRPGTAILEGNGAEFCENQSAKR